MIARKRWATGEDESKCREWALEQISAVRSRGAFKVRVKEGKDH
jgi:tRNASer (uridine44-2'-O)-methyltransferase